MREPMTNIGNIEHNGRMMYVQVTDTDHVYLSGYPVEQYSKTLRERALDLVASNGK